MARKPVKNRRVPDAKSPSNQKRRTPDLPSPADGTSAEVEIIPADAHGDGEVSAAEPAPVVLDPIEADNDGPDADGTDEAVDESRLPGLDEIDGRQEFGGALVPFDPLSRYLAELRR